MKRLRDTNLRSLLVILIIVMIAIVSFFLLIRNEIIRLSGERLSLIAEDYADTIAIWAGRVLQEHEVYRELVLKEGEMNEHTKELLATSYGRRAECRYGIYWGDAHGNYFDSSGWDPGPDYVPSSRPWYEEGLNHIRFEMGEPYMDDMTNNVCVSATARMIFDGEESVMAVDVYMTTVSDMVDDITAQEIENAFFVTRKSRIIVADSDTSMVGKKLNETESALYRKIDELIDRHFLGQTVLQANGTYYVNINRIENTDWLFVTCMSRSAMTEMLRNAEFIMVFIGLAVCIVLLLLTFWVSHKMNVADQKAKTDPLTYLLNRDGLKFMSVQAIEQNPQQGVLLIMDMDNFKRINDEFGHPEGDEVLKSFAGLLVEYFNRNLDFAARLGGDEFAVFVGRQVAREDISVMLDKFISLFHQTYDERYRAQKLSVSIGAAFVENCSCNYNELYRRADAALYTAKQNGKNRYALESV